MSSILAKDNNLKLSSINDAMDIMSSGLDCCLFTVDDIAPEFFKLSNGVAGEVFQKFVNYQFRVALVIPSDHSFGDHVTELVRDHKRHSVVRFFESIDEAREWLA